MLSHYLIVALRHVRRAPLIALLNVATLSLGLAGFIGAYSVAEFWQRADAHFPKSERTLVATSEWRITEFEGAEFAGPRVPRTSPWLGPNLRADFPDIEAVARLVSLDELAPIRAGDRAIRLRSFAADAEFLDIFNLPFIAGDADDALTNPGSVVLTQDAARRLFGEDGPLGKPVVIGNRYEGTVTGVLGEIPEPSHLGRSAAAPVRFDALVSRDFLGEPPPTPDGWLIQADITYVLLPDDGSVSAERVRRELPGFATRHVPADLRERIDLRFDLVPVGAVLGMAVDEALFRDTTGISISTALLALGVVVLAVACVNFANLATARAALRSREVGLRKAIGANGRQVAAQHLVEAGLAAGAGFIVALTSIRWLAPAIERSTGIDVGFALLADSESWAILAATLLLVTVTAGGYPAFILTRVPPIAALRSGGALTSPRQLAALLVGVQFTAAAFLLIAVTVVHMQNAKLERSGLGLADEPLLVIENLTEVSGIEQSTLRAELARLPEVHSVTALERPPWTVQSGTMPLASSPEQTALTRTALMHMVGPDFFRTFDVPLLAGRAFDPARSEDIAAYERPPVGTQHIVISRALAMEFGFRSAAKAVGEHIYIPSSGAARPFLIIGVAEDKPLLITSDRGPRPGAYLFNPDMPYHVVRLRPNDVAAGVAAVDALWRRLAPGVAIERRLADDYFNDAYSGFARVNDAFTALTAIALLISAIGLFAIATLVANRRVHEIGVRKTLGAHTADMVLMLLRAFAKPVLVANVIAWPLAYLTCRAYLEVFIDPIDLTFAPFALCLAATAVVAWLAVSGQTLRAARMAPARVLRQE